MDAYRPPVTAFLGSVVEFIEALTIVIASTVRGWRSAMLGTSIELRVMIDLRIIASAMGITFAIGFVTELVWGVSLD
jgi:uncharacterized membrane protein